MSSAIKITVSTLFLLLLIFPFTLSAQRTVSGRITDAGDGAPLSGVSVFIANTTVGMTTDTKGHYKLKIPGTGSYRLAVSHAGYQPVFQDIEPGKVSEVIDVALHIRELEEVTVAAKVKFRKEDIDLFWKALLGSEPSKKTIYATNPEAPFFYYNSKTKILKVTCHSPLQIINNETGYHIEFVLDYFTHDYNTNISAWEGQCIFSELEPNNIKQKNTWGKNREKVYVVSVTSFIRSLYRDSLAADGFLLTYTGDPTVLLNNLNELRLVEMDNFMSVDTVAGCKTLYIPSNSENVMLVCFGQPVTYKELGAVRFAQNGKMNWTTIGLYRNFLETPNDTVFIFPDGTFKNTLRLSRQFFSKPLTGLNMTLPIEYNLDVKSEELRTKSEELRTKSDELRVLHTDSLDSIARRFETQLSVFPQEKVYVQTDKPYYLSGERIWFRAHVSDAASHVPDWSANCVYAELFDARDSVVSRVKAGFRKDAYSGYLSIPEDVPEGNYTLRAYTNTMQDLDEDYFFIKNIPVGVPLTNTIQTLPTFNFLPDKKVNASIRLSDVNSSASIEPKSAKISINNDKPMNVKFADGATAINFNLPATEKQRVMLLDAMYDNNQPYRKYIKIPLPDDDFDVSFYPEGGNALVGCMGRIAVKAMQRDGTALNLSGTVFDSEVNELTQFKTDIRGMGLFMLKPEKNKTYYAVCANSKGQSKRFELPAAKEEGYALSASWLKDQLRVEVHQSAPLSFGKGLGERYDTLYLLIHTRGVVQDVRMMENTGSPVVFPKNIFPSGVSNLLLLNKDMLPLSERLIFVSNDDDCANLVCATDKSVYSTRSPVEFTLNLTDASGEPVQGNVSVSVTDDHEVAVDTTSNILTSLLLTSDLRGNIFDPAFYFKKDIRSGYVLELLMLTQGWRRYDTERILKNDFVYPDTLFAKGHEIAGAVNRILLTKERPADNADVKILSINGEYFGNTLTDRNGRFYLSDFDANDSTWFVVQAAPQKGRNDLELTLDKPRFPERILPMASVAPDQKVFADYADKAEQQYVNEHGVRMIHLKEVTVTAKKKPERQSSYYNIPDRSLTEEEIDRNPPTSLFALFSRVPGVIVSSSAEGLKLKISRFSKTPYLLIDDTPMLGFIDDLNVSDIAQIDVLTTITNLVPFGSKGANGVIAIYTRSGKQHLPKDKLYVKTIMPLGFQKSAEFYAPKYDTPDSNSKPDLRTTIHWLPGLSTDEGGKASFRFYTADSPSTYSVVIEGLTNEGKIIYKRDKIKVNREK